MKTLKDIVNPKKQKEANTSEIIQQCKEQAKLREEKAKKQKEFDDYQKKQKLAKQQALQNKKVSFSENELSKTLDMMKERFGFKIRERKYFSFGSFEDCRKMLFKALRLVDTTETIEWLDEYNEVAEWLSNNQGKGLLLSGDCGRGKSNIINKALPLLFQHRYQKNIIPIHIRELENRISSKDKNIYKYQIYCIDEVGSEKLSNNYSVKYYPFMELMSEAEENIKLCLFSSNLSKKQLEDKYDTRTVERILRLCKVIKFEGKSYRK